MAATAVYTRISKDRYDERGGVDRQRSDCDALCQREGWATVVYFEDNDVSAFSGKKRPGYDAMVQAVRDGFVDRIVAWVPDRLHRTVRELEDFIDLVEETGCAVSIVESGSVDLGSVEGRILARVACTFARAESEWKSRRLRRLHKQLAAEGRHRGGECPYGYDYVRGDSGKVEALVVNDAEAAVVREVVTRFIAGDGISAIGHDLNKRGIPAPRGGLWTSTTLRTMITSPRIAGQRAHKGVITKAQWPAIVTPEESTRARTLYTAQVTASNRRPVPRRYVLAGLVRCSNCGSNMVAGSSRQATRRYTCSGGLGKTSCGRRVMVAEPLEALVVEALLVVLDTPDLAKGIRGAVDVDAESELRAAEAQLDEIADAYANKLISMSEWIRVREAVAQRAKDARGRILDAQQEATILPFIGGGGMLREKWPSLPITTQNAIAAAVIDRVEIGPARPGARFDDDRVRIFWRF